MMTMMEVYYSMMTNNVISSFTKKCDVYFEKKLISKEHIINKYADFLSSTLSQDNKVGISLHTGSICFDIISFIIALLACISLDKTDAESILSSLDIGEIVLFRNERYRWLGLDSQNGNQYIKLEKDGKGKNGNTTFLLPYEDNKNLIKPYYGSSTTTDGRGIRKNTSNNRTDFISYILEVPETDVSSITGVSTVIVTEWNRFERLAKGLCISYKDSKRIGLLDVATASYFTDSGEEYQFGINPAKIEPVLKVTRKVSTARKLVLNKYGNKNAGLVVLGNDSVSRGRADLIDLLDRKTLEFAHVSVGIDSECSEDIVDLYQNASLFACTKEFLLQNSLPQKVKNNLTNELEKQIENILNKDIKHIIVEGGCSLEEYQNIKKILCDIKNAEFNNSVKEEFLINAYSLLNLFTTAIFPMSFLEDAIRNGKIMSRVSSPAIRLNELGKLANSVESLKASYLYVVSVLESLYKTNINNCPKYNFLRDYILASKSKKVVIVVPKAYYRDILSEDKIFNSRDITIVTANRFDNSLVYDEIIVVGDFAGKRFDVMKCTASENVFIMLYDCETYKFIHKKKQAKKFEEKLNNRLGIISDIKFDNKDFVNIGIEAKRLEKYVDAESELEEYIKNISILDIKKYAQNISRSEGDTLKSEVYAVGRFVSGEQILFSKYYNAVVFDVEKGRVFETSVVNLSEGNTLVFAKRDDYTKNMVDNIYEILQKSGRLSSDVINSTYKATYWKKILRKYRKDYDLSYRDIAERLKMLGSSLQEASVRQWLIEESHIIGPRDEATLRQIAELTQDSNLLNNTGSYLEAFRVVRKQRKEILEFIGQAIVEKLSGRKPPQGSVIEIVYDNVENLSSILELDTFQVLEEPVAVSVNLVNKPIFEWEVTS